MCHIGRMRVHVCSFGTTLMRRRTHVSYREDEGTCVQSWHDSLSPQRASFPPLRRALFLLCGSLFLLSRILLLGRPILQLVDICAHVRM